jgi:hypothetical protein
VVENKIYSGIRPDRRHGEVIRKGILAQRSAFITMGQDIQLNSDYKVQYRQMNCVDRTDLGTRLNLQFETHYSNYSDVRLRALGYPEFCTSCHYNQPGNSTGCFFLDKIPDQLFIRQTPTGVEIDGKNYSKVFVHIGDASGFTALRFSYPKVANLSIDPEIKYLAPPILTQLRRNPDKFDLRKVLLHPKGVDFVENLQSAGEDVIFNINSDFKLFSSKLENGGMHLVHAGVEDISMNSPFADLVTCYYPWTDMPQMKALNLAMRMLKEGGAYEIMSERLSIIKDVWDLFKDPRAAQVRGQVKSLKSSSGDLPVSLYDSGFEKLGLNLYVLRIIKNDYTREILNPGSVSFGRKLIKTISRLIQVNDVESLPMYTRMKLGR